MTLGCLPTHSQMAKFIQTSPEGAYAKVYEGELGEQGRCIRCNHDKETTAHAILECPDSAQRWERAHHRIEEMWREAEREWGGVDWLRGRASEYEGWTPMMAAAGMVPKGLQISMQDPAVCKLVNDTTRMILQTSFEVWERRNAAELEWLESDSGLKERKKAADRTGWRSTRQGARN